MTIDKIIKRIISKNSQLSLELYFFDRKQAVDYFNNKLYELGSHLDLGNNHEVERLSNELIDHSYIFSINGHNDIAFKIHDMLANTTQNEISLYIIGCCLKREIETKQNTIRSSEILSYLSKNSKYEKIQILAAWELNGFNAEDYWI
ncbi:MAG: hypothetical protein PHY08_12715 [Candidatus Cloacimonetes bacterium]|nr:hypothetical protein [Candidatus Cloacimonadota bacterium]